MCFLIDRGRQIKEAETLINNLGKMMISFTTQLDDTKRLADAEARSAQSQSPPPHHISDKSKKPIYEELFLFLIIFRCRSHPHHNKAKLGIHPSIQQDARP